ncbi:MAG: hypothetical protein ACO1SV_01685 [Fimbriimonas sp.]
MKAVLLAIVGGLLLVGCNPGEGESKPPELMNPTGSKANLSPDDAKRSEAIEEGGKRSAAAADEMARQMNAAKARSGGK